MFIRDESAIISSLLNRVRIQVKMLSGPNPQLRRLNKSKIGTFGGNVTGFGKPLFNLCFLLLLPTVAVTSASSAAR